MALSALDLQSPCQVSLVWRVLEKHCSKEDVFVCAHSKVLVLYIKLFVAWNVLDKHWKTMHIQSSQTEVFGAHWHGRTMLFRELDLTQRTNITVVIWVGCMRVKKDSSLGCTHYSIRSFPVFQRIHVLGFLSCFGGMDVKHLVTSMLLVVLHFKIPQMYNK